MLIILVLLFPTIIAPTNMAKPLSPAVLKLFNVESADSIAP